jgi:hypothetical protein
MDEFEKKIRENYLARKREDEKNIPAFDAVMTRNRQLSHTVKLHPNTVLKIAACIIGVMLMLSYFFFTKVNNIKQPMEIRSISLHPSLPSDSLLEGKPGNEYIWKWKSSTDRLVEDARQLTKSRTQTTKVI